MKIKFKKGIIADNRVPLIIAAIAILLVAVLTFNFVMNKPVVALAAPSKVYVEDIKIVHCLEKDLAKESRQLIADGYIIDKDYNFGNQKVGEDMLKSPDAERAYLAYKTTRNYRNAITDFSLMNMQGPYSFSAYDKLLKDQEVMAENLVNNLAKGIKLFRSNYEAKTPAALYAYQMLNRYYEDDSKKPLGDFYLTVDLSGEELKKVALQSQFTIFQQSIQWVGIACATVAGQDDWITQLYSMTSDQIDKIQGKWFTHETPAADVMHSIETVKDDYIAYDKFARELIENFGDEGYDLENKEDKEIYDRIMANHFKDPKEMALKITQLDAVYERLATLPYSDSKFTYSPYGDFTYGHAGKGAMINLIIKYDELETTDYYPIVEVLTEEQEAMMYLTGIELFITAASTSKESWAELAKKFDENIKFDPSDHSKQAPILSVYNGVDRSLFDSEGIALTDEAARRGHVDTEDSWAQGNMPFAAEVALYVGACIGFVTFIAGIAYSLHETGELLAKYSNAWNWTKNVANRMAVQGRAVATVTDEIAASIDEAFKFGTVSDELANFGVNKGSWFLRDYLVCFKSYVGGMIIKAGLAFLMVMVTIYFAFEIAGYFKKEYTVIPRIIINNFMKDDKSVYARYYAILDQNGNFVDVNIGGKREWIVPYISKDPNAGHPILADFTLCRSSQESLAKGYSPLCRIGEEYRFNMHFNTYNDPLYFGYKRDANAYPVAGSTFSGGAFTLALCGGILGGGALGWLGAWLIIKKKRKNKVLLIDNKTSGAV